MSARVRPLILVRGFGGPDVTGVRRGAYQGFNDGTVYPTRRATTTSTRASCCVR
ncbi:hypothetical protein ACFOZ0_02930 [Streptomyces yaanensis]|uniref:Uncharacterized protein n=1 Tax=Streptomyces yaanensis TaxID=1142239 RepID=A0ABV7S7L4_9ACTN|nr:hypothetical protein [Streptomyces sp. CGMCC 4.7035]WNB99833.1 hypothetical protein Q2K21_18145 [Streptomyces sp. CGMCC 4.7035]